jgi:hypothetical protein
MAGAQNFSSRKQDLLDDELCTFRPEIARVQGMSGVDIHISKDEEDSVSDEGKGDYEKGFDEYHCKMIGMVRCSINSAIKQQEGGEATSIDII